MSNRKTTGEANNELYWAIQGAIIAANRETEYAHLAGVEGEAGENPYVSIRKILLQGAKDAKALQRHVHQWSENDYCAMCGADGRA